MEKIIIDGFECTYTEKTVDGVSVLSIVDPEGTRERLDIPREINGSFVVEIKAGAIAGAKLKKIFIPNTIEEIEDYAFSKCTDVEEYIVEENSQYFECLDGDLYEKDLVKLIRVAKHKDTKEFFVPFEVEEIGPCAFSNTSYEHIFAGESVKKIGKGAFSYCESLSTVEICDLTEEIGEKAFVGSRKLKKIGVGKNNPCFMDSDGVLYTRDQRQILCFPAGLKEIKLPTAVEKIGDYAFFCALGLKKISLPKSVKHIGKSSFESCRNLCEVEIKGRIDYVGKSAFIDCRKLKKLEFLKGEMVIEEKAFKDCECLEEIVLPEGLCKISDSMLQDCRVLNKVTLPTTLVEIGAYALGGCYKLESIDLPKDLIKIGEGAFGFTGLTEVTIPKGIKVIEKSTFSVCHALKKVTLPSGIENIDDAGFICSGLEEIELPEGLLRIGGLAFFDCAQLKSVKIPKGVAEIKNGAFQACNKYLVIYCNEKEKPQEWGPQWCGDCKVVFSEND